ncbi:MAG: AAA family ATPase [Nanoarchaeota archaeon]
MKIAFIGTHGTGKTTLAYSITGELKRIGKNATMITEVARKCPLPINEKGTAKSQLWIMSSQISHEVEEVHKYSHVVCDRSILDTYAYGKYSNINEELLKKLVEYWIGTYDILFKVNPAQEYLVEDGFRSTNKEFQSKVDQIINELLTHYNLKYFELPKENQIQFIIEKIKEHENNGQQKLNIF